MNISTAPCEVLSRIREQRPLILSLTNNVVQSLTANMLYAIGAVPAMLVDREEIEDMLRAGTSGLLINLGTLSHEQADAMRHAVQVAQECKIPWVLDPVAVGLLQFRTQFARELLSYRPTLIRGNASEILAMADDISAREQQARGPESQAESHEAIHAAQSLARSARCCVLLTGEIDYISDGVYSYALTHGHPLMTRVTGVGCAMGALAAACCACAQSPLEAAAACSAILGIAGERAAAITSRPGSFAQSLLDELDAIEPEEIESILNLQQI